MTEPQEIAFQNWLQNIRTSDLECRVGRHKLPDITDRRTRGYVVKGVKYLERDCLRKCGTTVTTYVDATTGLLARRAKTQHHYDKGYLMPREARTGKGYTKELLAELRLELIERKQDWITEE